VIKDFFVSYNSADSRWAEWIAWQLEEAGYTALLQAWDFRPSSNFVLEMQRATTEAKRTIAVLSPNYLAAHFTQPEWAAAFAEDPRGEKGLLLPVRVRECDLRGLLSTIIYIDLIGLDETTAKETLLSGVYRERAKPQIPPAFPGVAQHTEGERPLFPGALADPEIEAEMWAMVKDSNRLEDIRHFMEAYPKSRFTPLAHLKLEQLLHSLEVSRRSNRQALRRAMSYTTNPRTD